MKTRNPITTPTLEVAQSLRDLLSAPLPAAIVLQKLGLAFAKLSAADPCPRMRVTYAADLERIKALSETEINGATAEERWRARQALRTLADDYRNVAQDNPADDAEQDALLATGVARAAAKGNPPPLRAG